MEYGRDENQPWDWSDGENAAGGKWLPKTGTFMVKVINARKVTAYSGNQGIELTLADRQGRMVKDTLWNTEKAVNRNWHVITALGLTADEQKRISPAVFLGKYCQITTKTENEKYTGIDEWTFWRPESPSEQFDPPRLEEERPFDRPYQSPDEKKWTPASANDDVPF